MAHAYQELQGADFLGLEVGNVPFTAALPQMPGLPIGSFIPPSLPSGLLCSSATAFLLS